MGIFQPAIFVYQELPWEPKTFIFRGYNPYLGGLKPSFFMVLGSKGRVDFSLHFSPEVSMPRRVAAETSTATVTLSTFETLRAEIAAAARLRHRALGRPRQLSVHAETSSSSEDLHADVMRRKSGVGAIFVVGMMMMMMMMMI